MSDPRLLMLDEPSLGLAPAVVETLLTVTAMGKAMLLEPYVASAVIATALVLYAPWRLDTSTYRNMLIQPRVVGFRTHPILHAEWAYIDIAPNDAGNLATGLGKRAAN